MAEFMGVPAQAFDVMYPEKAKDMKKMVLAYIKVLRTTHFNENEDSSKEMKNGMQRDILQMDEDGFPVAPQPHSWTIVTKADIEPLYRLYITRHYRTCLFLYRPSHRISLTKGHGRACMP